MADYLTSKQWGQVFAHAWKDPEFKVLLEKDPTEAIKQISHKVGWGDSHALSEVPARPADMSDEQVDRIANEIQHYII